MIPENDDGIRDGQFEDEDNGIGLQETDENTMRNDIKKDYSLIETLRIKLEKDLGTNIVREVYRIVDQNTPVSCFSYDTDLLSRIISKELGKEFKDLLVKESIKRIPEFYSIVFAERQLVLDNNNIM